MSYSCEPPWKQMERGYRLMALHLWMDVQEDIFGKRTYDLRYTRSDRRCAVFNSLDEVDKFILKKCQDEYEKFGKILRESE